MLTEKLVVVPPPIESLLDAGETNFLWPSLWPEEIKTNPEVKAQAERRRNLFRKLDLLFRQIPQATLEITSAIDSEKVDPETEIYNLMADFLNADPSHKRLVLYLPFELIPDKAWKPPSRKLAISIERFINSYVNCWRKLLKENSVRANFSDGDILEPELSPNGQVMVCKAAHLIPKLVQKGLISAESVLDMLDKNPNEILRNSIIDILPVLADMSLLSGYNLPVHPKTKLATRRFVERGLDWLYKLSANSEFELRKLDMRAAADRSRNMPKLRILWERQDRQNKLVDEYADGISVMTTEGTLSFWDISKFLASKPDMVPCLAIINGIRKFLESIAIDHPNKALKLFDCHDYLMKLWNDENPEIREALTSMLLRLANLGVIDEKYLGNYGIRLPQLDMPVFKGRYLVEDEIKHLEPKIGLIAKKTEMSELIYPVVILFGSRLKGYAGINADLDIGVFIRPGVSRDKRPKIQRILSRIFRGGRIDGKIVEFWLEEEGKGLRIKNLPGLDVSLADGAWIHLLFGSIWLGKEDAVTELYTKLLPGFIYSRGKILEGCDARIVWLDEMERDVLQYRLMHKGYRRIFPEQGGINTKYAENLDPQSSFWDSGYRRLATKLFISRVFLPQL